MSEPESAPDTSWVEMETIKGPPPVMPWLLFAWCLAMGTGALWLLLA